MDIYSILVFNRKRIPELASEAILAAVTESNYQTLCRQYGLDPALIEPAREHLHLAGPSVREPRRFALLYGPAGHRPVMVTLFNFDQPARGDLAAVLAEAPETLGTFLQEALEGVRIDLSREQLADLGLLLAYELARWAAVSGEGVVRGLDGRWYRLNRHRAFLPVGD